MQKIKFKPLQKNESAKYKLHVLLAPHINNQGAGNNGWLGDYKVVPMLFAERDGVTLALACFYSGFLKKSIGYVGTSEAILS